MGGMYGDDQDDSDADDILEPMIEEFSIKTDVQITPLISIDAQKRT